MVLIVDVWFFLKKKKKKKKWGCDQWGVFLASGLGHKGKSLKTIDLLLKLTQKLNESGTC